MVRATSEGELQVRTLTEQERAQAFARGGSEALDLTGYVELLRECVGGKAYRVELSGVSAMALHRRFVRAARKLGLRLRFAVAVKGARTLVFELA
jgi:hypothetical protein